MTLASRQSSWRARSAARPTRCWVSHYQRQLTALEAITWHDPFVARKRVGLRRSFKLAGRAAFGTPDTTGGDASMAATIAVGVWWCLVGVPEQVWKDDGGT